MNKTKARSTLLDWLLVIAIVALSIPLLAQVSWLAIDAWQHSPRPGMQMDQQYVIQESNGAKAAPMPVNYLLYLPPDYTWRKKWPLVVYLHGVGSRGQDLNLVRREGPVAMVEQGHRFGFILLSPQCPANSGWNHEVETLLGLIESVSTSQSVDRDRVYLTGYSMGGYGTWKVAYNDPGRFAAIAPLCGGGDADKGGRLANVPVWAFHGAKDTVVPLKLSEAMVQAVTKAGGHVQFTVYPDEGHGICGLTYQNEKLYEWLLAQRRQKESQ